MVSRSRGLIATEIRSFCCQDARVGIIRVRGSGVASTVTQPWRIWVLLNKKMKTDVWALVGIVVTTIQTQQVTH